MKPGKIVYQLIIFALAIFFANSFAQQELPNYPERTFQTENDSLKIKPDKDFKDFYTIEATEGSIDPDEYRVGKVHISYQEIIFNEDNNLAAENITMTETDDTEQSAKLDAEHLLVNDSGISGR